MLSNFPSQAFFWLAVSLGADDLLLADHNQYLRFLERSFHGVARPNSRFRV